MKHNIFIGMICLLFLAACQSDDDGGQNPNDGVIVEVLSEENTPSVFQEKDIKEVGVTDDYGNAYLPAGQLMNVSLEYNGNSMLRLPLQTTRAER
ncbi:hypothetical protein OOZ15_07755 [Galbibacter sp. EGI 63066]|uniref:hypothetical protein n=1 Tax=Galbibacter sp. EGI 63066 TaxID=2993559 RepID=UPI0022489CD0|nr:hypothetical protein [Galbibacter sp. EGI 63066]MCX2679828.1 hypothetical protein [Galbibacter sp. EGI 63066]